MTPVYSGGLVYEYSEEGNGYGLVTISGNSVTTTTGFTDLENQLKANPAPSGSGDFSTTNQPAACPADSADWDISPFSGENLPAIPSGAVKYMSQGAGKGPGLTGDGSQNAGGASSGTATPGSGTVTATATHSGSSSTGGAAASAAASGAASSMIRSDASMTPFVFAAVALFSTFFGATLL